MIRYILILVLAYYLIKVVKSILKIVIHPPKKDTEVRGTSALSTPPFREEDIEDAKFKDLPDKKP